MRRKNIKNNLYPIGDILFPLLKRRGLSCKIEENKLFKLWPDAVGEKISQQTKPDAFRNSTLFVKTTSPIWIQQLHFIKDEIMLILNAIYGKNIVKEIRFSIGYLAEDKPSVSAKNNQAFLHDRDKKMIAACTSSLSDPELAAIFRRVMRGEISRRRRLEAQQAREK
jgi:hypothetical protein